ncbi:MAG: molybdopterin-dependent oxidoreductase [Actinomycetota bacterium]
MAGRRTNLALLILLGLAFATGALAFAVGTGWSRLPVVLHGVVALAIVLLAPWKSVIAKRGVKRRRRGTVTSIAFTVIVTIALVFGVLHSTGLAMGIGPLSSMQVHVGAALVALPLALWHVIVRRIRVHRTDVARRQLLRSAALMGGAATVYAATEGIVHAASLPGADRRFTGSFERGSGDPDAMPVTQWLNDSIPEIDPASWRLVVRGSEERSYPLEELAAFGDRVVATLDCTGGWYAEQEWGGVRLSRLIDDVGDFRSVVVTSATGYKRRFSVDVLDDLYLAVDVGGAVLSAGHGVPARLVAPGRRGFWWVKWVESIELDAVPAWLQLPFPPS